MAIITIENPVQYVILSNSNRSKFHPSGGHRFICCGFYNFRLPGKCRNNSYAHFNGIVPYLDLPIFHHHKGIFPCFTFIFLFSIHSGFILTKHFLLMKIISTNYIDKHTKWNDVIWIAVLLLRPLFTFLDMAYFLENKQNE